MEGVAKDYNHGIEAASLIDCVPVTKDLNHATNTELLLLPSAIDHVPVAKDPNHGQSIPLIEAPPAIDHV